MALGLTGWVDTGYRLTLTAAATVEIQVYFGVSSATLAGATFDGPGAGPLDTTWSLRGTGDVVRNIICPLGSQSQGNRSFILTGAFAGSPVTLFGPYTWTCQPDAGPAGVPAWTPATTYTEAAGPYRLGVRRVLIDPLTPLPYFARHYRYEYAWFSDGYTSFQQSMGGYSKTTWASASGGWQTSQNTALTPVNLGDIPKVFSIQLGSKSQLIDGVQTGGIEQVRVTNISIAGSVVDMSGLASSTIVPGVGTLTALSPATGTDGGGGGSIGPPWYITENFNVRDFNTAEMSAIVTDADGNDRTTPFSIVRQRRQVSWTNTESPLTARRLCAIKSSWATAQDPPLPVTDLVVTTDNDPPIGSGDYLPLSITLLPSVNVQRPDGNTPSAYVSSDTGKMTVAEGPTDTVFTVDAPGATATRTLASVWRDRVGLGAGAELNPLFGIENYERTKHETGDDVWGWSSHGYLRVKITGPAGQLTLTVRGVHLVITDPHVTGSARTTGYMSGLSTVPFEATYLVTVTGEPVDIDLLFPQEGGPFYLSRVDTLTLGGFKAGTYTLSRMELTATAPAYLKVASGVEVQGGDYSAMVAALNGAFVFGNVPDQANKPEESGDYGGGARYIQPLTGSGTGTILDSQYSLEQFASKLHLIEGFEVVYSQAVHDARMVDAYGAEISPELAQDIKPLVPYVRLPPGDAVQPDCALATGELDIVTGIAFTIYWRKNLWGGLEALVTQDGGRAPAGATIGARRVGGSAFEATGTTDEDGYVCVAPVPANGLVEWELAEVT